ncbi:hypothetical protein [Methylotuvimicrobium buryatense]|uniref:Uncharacterized protein n=1 Tax=Methylotuvimicrobium buryatense TaxID=95641 RepID=A0A4P9UP73_METBY|nr:hypothetical protein [Methylotuvimicrobium buryatense]QCW82031.1 hypothetical protein EQU24_07020 [Methylotuvimicrobium buryatense]
MLLLTRFLFALFTAPPVLLALVILYAVEPEPSVQADWQMNDEDIERAKEIFEGSPVSDNIRTVELNERDLNIALDYILDNYLSSHSILTLDDTSIGFKISLHLPKNLFGKYLNLQFNLAKTNGSTHIHSLKIGLVEFADELAEWLIKKTIKYAHLKQHYILVTEQILDFHFTKENLRLTYITDPAFAEHTADLLHRAKDRQSMIFYQQKLTEVIDNHDPEWLLSLADLIQPLFKLAHQRSSLKTAIKENRIVIFTINSYVNKHETMPYLPRNITAKPHTEYPVFLYRRIDLAKHFIASATLTATGGGHLANMIGLEKELSDARSGSGFSFVDLAGNRAGMRFGQLAVSNPENARRLQQAMAEIKDYTAFMPDVRDLPENLDRSAFKKNYGTVYSPKYQDMLMLIDNRIDQLEIYQD